MKTSFLPCRPPLFSFLRLVVLFAFIFSTASIACAESERKIGSAVQRGDWVYVYDEKGSQLFTKSAGGGEKDGLMGYTGSTVSIRRGDWVYVYDAKGSQVSTIAAGN